MFHVYTNGKTLEIPAHKMRVDAHGNLVLSDAQNKNLLIISNGCWDGCEFKRDEQKIPPVLSNPEPEWSDYTQNKVLNLDLYIGEGIENA